MDYTKVRRVIYDESEDSSDIEGEFYESSEEEKEKGGMKPCRVLSFQDIRERQEKDIETVSSICSLSQAESTILLQHFKWNDMKLLDEWFPNEQKVRKDSGLFQLNCSICMNDHFITEMKALA
ncbi:hypothetical protein SUGI_1009650 [Cryptomeria japonica]|nr:hypothetical protein SUGI_1009650 [Cryptomeria japonica]